VVSIEPRCIDAKEFALTQVFSCWVDLVEIINRGIKNFKIAPVACHSGSSIDEHVMRENEVPRIDITVRVKKMSEF